MADAPDELIDLTGDSDVTLSATSEDDDFHRAIAMSLQSMPTSPPAASKASTPDGAGVGKPDPQTESTAPVGGILGMNRKQQEEERLARLKRKRGETVSPPLIKQDQQAAGHLGGVATKQGELSGASTTEAQTKKEIGYSPPANTPELQYPAGVVKKTWAFGFNRANDIKLEEVLQSSQLEAAVFSSFQWDWDWLVPKLNTKRTSFVFVMQAKGEREKNVKREDFKEIPNVRLCFPPMEGQINCMHSKLMLLFYPGYLRVVVPTGNLTPYDWGEPFGDLDAGVMENTVFLVDLPQKERGADEHKDSEISFLQSMLYFLKAMKSPEDVLRRLKLHDFSKLAQHGFIHSIGGPHYGDAWRETGAPGLGQFLHKLGLRTLDTIDIDFVASSLGGLDDEFLRSLYLVAQGDSGLAEYTYRTAKSTPASVANDLQRRLGKEFPSGWRQHFRFYFPSENTVKASIGGPGCGGTICFQSQWWNGPKFPVDLMRDCQSRRGGMLMHNKIWFTRYSEPVNMKSGQKALGWVYVGSANLSQSAWGKLVRDRTTQMPKLNCRNWECGVLLPILEDKSARTESPGSGQSSNPLDVFKHVVPVPMVVPGQTYQGNRKPWFGSEQ